MSHPPVRHPGEGETRATYRPADAPPDLTLGATSVRHLATGAGTGGDFGLHRWETAGPGGPAPHFHRTIGESFHDRYLL